MRVRAGEGRRRSRFRSGSADVGGSCQNSEASCSIGGMVEDLESEFQTRRRGGSRPADSSEAW